MSVMFLLFVVFMTSKQTIMITSYWNAIEQLIRQISAALEFPADLLSIVGLEVGFVLNKIFKDFQRFFWTVKIFEKYSCTTFARLKVLLSPKYIIFMLQVLGRRWSAALSMLLVKTMISFDHIHSLIHSFWVVVNSICSILILTIITILNIISHHH